jgi:adenine-specific DNA-methyltransferase
LLYNSCKIILAKIAIRSEAFLDAEGEFASVNTNCLHSISINPKYVLSWINSKAFQYCFECFFEGLKMSGGYLLYSAPNLSAMFIKDVSTALMNLFVSKVDEILLVKTTDILVDISKIDRQIDIMFYKLFSLSYHEACRIEGNNNWMTKEEYEAFKLTTAKEEAV